MVLIESPLWEPGRLFKLIGTGDVFLGEAIEPLEVGDTLLMPIPDLYL